MVVNDGARKLADYFLGSRMERLLTLTLWITIEGG